MTDQDCIRKAQDGDQAAIRELYERHSPRVYAVVRRLAGDDALAEDWAQEAWVRAIRALPGFRGDAQFSTWIHRIAVNSALHGRRWRERRTSREITLPVAHRETEEQVTRADEPMLRLTLQRALDRLPEGMRQIVVLHDVQGFTHEEIGSLLGIAAGTSKSQLFKARAHLRRILRPETESLNGEEACHI
ncbi:MAG: sigma-70 family RNA polymerase sigma factor [Longimicrobiales bacterium]